jgi:PII-like signaling protein
MQGFQVTFFTQQDRRHGSLPLGEWLIQEARRLGVAGATLIAATEGFGHDKTLHSAHFFELADQPIEVLIAMSASDADRLFSRLREENINVFYVKTPIEFGMTGES